MCSSIFVLQPDKASDLYHKCNQSPYTSLQFHNAVVGAEDGNTTTATYYKADAVDYEQSFTLLHNTRLKRMVVLSLWEVQLPRILIFVFNTHELTATENSDIHSYHGVNYSMGGCTSNSNWRVTPLKIFLKTHTMK